LSVLASPLGAAGQVLHLVLAVLGAGADGWAVLLASAKTRRAVILNIIISSVTNFLVSSNYAFFRIPKSSPYSYTASFARQPKL
jgi:hypothetical protein